MKIVIKNKVAFAACQAAQSTDRTRKYLTGVLIEPDGTVVATNGHYMVYCKDVLEPFSGEPFILAAKQITAAQRNSDGIATINTDEGAGFIEFNVNQYMGRRNYNRQLVVANIIDGAFPKWREIVPTFDDDREGNTEIAFDAGYAAKVASIVNKAYPHIFIELNKNDKPMLAKFSQDKDDTLRMVLMPVKV